MLRIPSIKFEKKVPRLLEERLDVWMSHPVLAVQLLDHQLAVSSNLDRGRAKRRSCFKTGDQGLVLGLIVGRLTDVLRDVEDRVTASTTHVLIDDSAYRCRAWIAPGAAVAEDKHALQVTQWN